jgi:hypothetical protein
LCLAAMLRCRSTVFFSSYYLKDPCYFKGEKRPDLLYFLTTTTGCIMCVFGVIVVDTSLCVTIMIGLHENEYTEKQ